MANGTIAFDTLSTSGQISGTAKSVDTDYLLNGANKIWFNLNGSGTAAFRDSFNVASLTDNGTGSYTVTFSNNMGDANYSATSGLATASDADAFQPLGIVDRATNTLRVDCEASNGSQFDGVNIDAQVAGDLA